MKKITMILAVLASFALASCSKFEVENTATEALAGNWMCTVYKSNGSEWYEYYASEYVTYNTSANKPTEMWINDYKNFWGTLCKVDCNVNDLTFGKDGVEYTDEYYGGTQKIWGGKLTVNGATAPESSTTVDKIEFFISFSDDDDPFCTTYYVVGYRRTGFPEDDDQYIDDWTLPAIQ